MKCKINIRKLICILIGLFLCAIPIEAKAADYEASFKFYKYDSKYGLNYEDFGSATWLDDYISSDSSVRPEEITDLSELKPGDILVVSPILKTINPTATAVSIYFRYNKDVFTYYPGWETTDMRSTKDSSDAIFPYVNPLKGKWSLDSFTIAAELDNDTLEVLSEDGEVALVIRDNSTMANRVPYNYAGDRGFAFLFLKVKDGADLSNASFTFATETNPIIDNTSTTGKFVTMASTTDNMPIDIDTTDYIPEKKASSVKTLKDLVVANGSDKYTDLSWTSGSTETSFNSVIPATISSASLSITPFHSAASIMCTAGCTGSASAGATMTANLTGLTTGSNSIEVTVTAEDGSTQVYPIDIKKLNDDTSLGNVTLTNGITLNYDSATKTYSATGVPYSTTSANISASVTTNSNAVIDSMGTTWNVTSGAINNVEWNLTNTGATANTGTIKVNAENCDTTYTNIPGNTCTTTTYNVSVSRNAPKTIATLKSLTVGGSLVTGFVPDDATHLEYTIADTTSASINIAGVVTDNSGANITSGTGTVSLNLGDNTFNIVVTAEDGTTSNTYKIKVKRLSTDATLSGLSITSSPQGTMNPSSFATGTKSYTYTYDETVTSVSISATATNSNAMVQIGSDTSTKGSATGSVTPTDGGTVNITTMAEDGTTTETYTITFARKKSSVATLKDLSVQDAAGKEYITSFNSSTKTYTITVDHEITSLNVSATATSTAAKINNGSDTYTGTIDNLNFTSNSFVLTVSPEEGSDETYTINVTRKQSDNANLTDLMVDGVTVNGFNKLDDSLPFDIGSVNNNVTSLNITYNQENQYSKVVIEDNNLSVGDNIVKVKVTSQDGTNTREYKIKVRRKSTDVGLSSLTVTSTPQGTLTGPDSNNQYTYTYDRSVTSVNIEATANSGIPVLGTGTHNIASGDATLTVTPEDASVSVGVYTIKFVQELESDSTLSNLVVSKNGTNYTLDKTFNPTEKNYSLTVGSEVDTVDISTTLGGNHVKNININGIDTVNPSGTITKGINLNPGSNNISIIVTAEDNSSTTYTLNITRTINTDASLSDLKVDGIQVPNFNSSTTTYTLNAVDYTKDSILIEYTAAAGAIVTGDTGTQTLNPGDNKFDITVASQDGNNHITYTINIRRKLNDAKITNLTSSTGTTLTKDSEFNYTLDIPSGTNKVSLTPTFATGATLKSPASLDNVDITNISEITFEVQAEDTTYTNTYIVSLNKLSSTNNNLATLSVDQGALTPAFSKDETNYKVTVDSTIDTIHVTATVEDSKSSISGDGDYSLNFGDTTIVVTVTAEDNSTKDYTIVVTRSESNDTSLSDLTINGTTIAGFTSTKDNYEISLPFGTTSFTLNATPTNANANIPASELGNKTISSNPESFTFTVTAQDGTEKTYTIKITVAANNDTSIDSLTVLDKTPTWNSNENRYELTVDGETLTIGPSDIEATFGNGASITNKDSELTLIAGDNTYKFTVTAADGTTTKEYEVLITREESTINTLDSITTSVGTLTPVFKPDENTYKLTLPEGTTDFTLSATPTSKNPATTVTGIGDFTIPVTNNPISILVTAEDGSVNTYEITVEVEDSTCDLDCDLDGDGVCDLNCDTDGDGVCDTNCDTDGDGTCDLNCDTDGDGTCDLNCDTDGDGVCDTNCDSDGDGTCDLNCDSDGDGTCDLNCDTDGDGVCDTNCDSDGDGTCDLNCDTDGDGICDLNCDTDGDGVCDLNCDTDGDGICDTNCQLDKITSNIHTIDDDYILTVKPSTKFDDTFKGEFENEPTELKLYLADGTTAVTDQDIGTGMILKLERNGQVLDQKAIVVLGDTNGDGMHDIEDAVKIVNHYLTIGILEGAYKKAADTNYDDILDIEDAVKVVNQYLGIGNLFNN